MDQAIVALIQEKLRHADLWVGNMQSRATNFLNAQSLRIDDREETAVSLTEYLDTQTSLIKRTLVEVMTLLKELKELES